LPVLALANSRFDDHSHWRLMNVVTALGSVVVIQPSERPGARRDRCDQMQHAPINKSSAFALARQQGRHHMAVKKELEAAGVKPTLDPAKVGATFYWRKDLAFND
jgi:hypothetical protein